MKQKSFLFIFAAFFLSCGLFFTQKSTAFAQDISSLLDTGVAPHSVFNLQTTPQVPGAYDTVKASLVSYEINLDVLPITWTLNGKVVASGTGEKMYSFKMGSIGTTMNLVVQVQTPTDQYGTVSKEVSFTPENLDTLWQADTYTPPFYRGKALPTSQSTVKIVAYPSFVTSQGTINPNYIVYKWKNGYDIDGNQSGFGKNVYVYTSGYPNNTDSIQATATSMDGTLSVQKMTNIVISRPKIIFYENRALEDVRYESALGNVFKIPESQLTLRAEPYFFSFPSRNDNNGDFEWTLNGGALTPNPDNKSEYIVQAPSKGNGGVTLSLSIGNNDHYIQTDSRQLTLTYGNP